MRSASIPTQPDFPFLDLKAEYGAMREEIMAAVARVFENQQFVLGPEVEELEREIAQFTECRAAVGCASGTDALVLALAALGVKAGDEVVTTPFTFVASAGAVAWLGARPVFADIGEDFNLDPGKIAGAITTKTRAILPVHLFGLCADMAPILEVATAHGVPVIEDAAQAIGARYRGTAAGSLGAIGCFSFFPSKNLGGAGDGGMTTTQSEELAARLRVLHLHGGRRRYEYDVLGTNSRLDALQAAVLRVKLKHLAQWTELRRRHAARYQRLFAEFGLDRKVRLPQTPAGREHVFNQFVVRTAQRDELRQFLTQHGVPCEIYYPYPLHLQPAFAFLGHKQGDFPQAEKASREVLALPVSPMLTEQNQRRVVETMAAFFRGRE